MVPLPTAADDHQRKNAEAMQRAGATAMILQKDLTGRSLTDQLSKLINDPAKILEMGASAKSLAREDAAEATVDIIEELARKRK
jgi:UDP-N-acetylglucosamine--N-acetylmuramyl-(pentapeptide) pyrophosphoryl-undecaprenol N-acetylglucosamine transferase